MIRRGCEALLAFVVETKEKKPKLQELLNKDLIHLSISPWGASVLFIKQKDGLLKP